tara:strand:+ start:1587 stop:2030 length:444 start_codon:yes stop_codon:yes gene_type:complete
MIKIKEKKLPNLEIILLKHLSTSIIFGHSVQFVHWNYTGPDFLSIHEFLGNVYEKLQKYDDELAERMRSMELPVDSRISRLITLSDVGDFNTKQKYLPQIIDGLEVLIRHANRCIEAAPNDDVLIDHFSDRLNDYTTYLWMLKSQIK